MLKRSFIALAGRIVITAFLIMNISSAHAGTEIYRLGDTSISIVTTKYGAGGHMFVALHENESTSVTAAKTVLRNLGGYLVELKAGGSRNIAFTHKGKRYHIDPNRIFSDIGVSRTLQGGNHPEVRDLVKGLAVAIIRSLRGANVIVSLHNNTEGSYSVLSYKPGGQHAREASALHIVASQDADDFFFVTNSRLFGLIKESGYNVVLQSGAATDDGSLSVYAARVGTLYVNVEAQNGHLAVQTKMLQTLLRR